MSDGLADDDGLVELLSLELGDILADGDRLALIELDGEIDGLEEGETLLDTEELGETLEEGD